MKLIREEEEERERGSKIGVGRRERKYLCIILKYLDG
jgi:hypothetical protein